MASATATTAVMANYLKRIYTMPETTAQVSKNNPTLKMLKRDSSKLVNGEAFYITVKTQEAYGLYGVWATGSRSNYTPSTSVRYLIDTPVRTYSNIDFDNEFLERNKAEGKLLDVMKAEVADQNNKFGNMLEHEFWASSQSRSLGQLTSDPGTPVAAASVTLNVNAEAIYNLEVGMKIKFADDKDLSTVRTNSTAVVVAKDTVALTATCTVILGFDAGITSADHIFLVDAVINTRHKGFRAWVPDAAPSDSFLGVTRTGLGEAVYGWRFSYQGSVEESLKYAMIQMGKNLVRDLKQFYFCMSAGDWYTLEQELGQRVIRDEAATKTIGTEVISVRTPFGVVKCITIPCLADGRCFGVDFSSWTLHHNKGIPHVVNEDGLDWRLNDAGADTAIANDGMYMILRSRTFYTCEAPIRNCTIALA